MSRGSTLTVQQILVSEECVDCGTTFGIPRDLRDQLVSNKRTFYCPVGHPQSYVGESDDAKIERLSRELVAEKDAAKRVMRQRDKAQRELKTVKQRVAGGVCPCCNRSFVQLTRHMKSQHPGYAEENHA